MRSFAYFQPDLIGVQKHLPLIFLRDKHLGSISEPDFGFFYSYKKNMAEKLDLS